MAGPSPKGPTMRTRDVARTKRLQPHRMRPIGHSRARHKIRLSTQRIYHLRARTGYALRVPSAKARRSRCCLVAGPAPPDEQRSHRHHHQPGSEKPQVPCQLALSGMNVVEPEKLVVDQPLNEIEEPP